MVVFGVDPTAKINLKSISPSNSVKKQFNFLYIMTQQLVLISNPCYPQCNPESNQNL